jgi:hypothetical protein
MIDPKIGPKIGPPPNIGPSPSEEQKRAEDEKTTVWAFIWTLFVFKILTIAAIIWAAEGSGEASIVLLATNWFWVLIPMFAVAGPLLFHHRLRKVRRRRSAIVRSEWMLE